jgi:hypothetical protein
MRVPKWCAASVSWTETRTYAFERDDLGQDYKATRPDGSTVERAYHGFSNQPTGLKIDGRVIATQTVANDSTLKSRTVGNRTLLR